MDEGPFRVSRPAQRRAASQPAPAARREEAPQPAREQVVEPAAVSPVRPGSAKEKKNKSSNQPSKLLIIVAAIAVVLVAGLFFWLANKGGGNGIDSSKYQAVFLSNGQHYFGKLEDVNDRYMKLTDIFYLERSSEDGLGSESDEDQKTPEPSTTELKKLTDSTLFDPEDEMFILRDNILYYENLNPEGRATRAIEEYKKTSN